VSCAYDIFAMQSLLGRGNPTAAPSRSGKTCEQSSYRRSAIRSSRGTASLTWTRSRHASRPCMRACRVRGSARGRIEHSARSRLRWGRPPSPPHSGHPDRRHALPSVAGIEPRPWRVTAAAPAFTIRVLTGSFDCPLGVSRVQAQSVERSYRSQQQGWQRCHNSFIDPRMRELTKRF
jgi:hypothetical protein